MNFAILSAVSTKEQAASDKVSLDAQENKSRELGLSKGWHESCEPFRIPGASRSFYVNLSDAEKDIPPLAAARLVVEDLPRWITHDDPRQVNLLLLRLFHHITLTPDLQVTVHFQE